MLWFLRWGVAVRHKQVKAKHIVGPAIFYGITAVGIPLLWQFFLQANGTYRFTFLPLTLSNLLMSLPRWPVIIVEMVKRLLNPYWNFIWVFAGGVLIFRRTQIFRPITPAGWLILPVAGFLWLISLTYIFSRFSPYLTHLNNSVERLILQGLPLGLWWLVGQSVAVGWVAGRGKQLK